MNKKEITSKSKFLSLLLRHKPETISLTLDDNGWANVEDLLVKWTCREADGLTMATLEEIVKSNDKKRFEFNEDKTKIRACQGHSIGVDVQLKKVEPPEYLYHGTASRFLDSIKENGLLKQTRNHVHLSPDHFTAIGVGKRHGEPIVLGIRAGEMSKEGFDFFLSNNGVWLTDNVPVKFIDFDIKREDHPEVIPKFNYEHWKDRYKKHDVLLKNIQNNLVLLRNLLNKLESHWVGEDRFYRFYYGSLKVYWLQENTKEITDWLRKLNPYGENEPLDGFFEAIYAEGCSGRQFKLEDNEHWCQITRPMIEAFFHAKYFLELAVKYGEELKEAPESLPSGWAALLCLYDLR